MADDSSKLTQPKARGWYMPKPVELDALDFADDNSGGTVLPTRAKQRGAGEYIIHGPTGAHYGIPVETISALVGGDRAEALKPFALRMFCDHYPITHIARCLDLSTPSLHKWKREEAWEDKRLEVERKYANAIVMARLKQTMEITCDAIDVIGKVMKKTKNKSEDELDLRDAEAVSRILANLDKIVRLSTGAPTEITESRDGSKLRLPKNAKELAEILKGDPFIDVTPDDSAKE